LTEDFAKKDFLLLLGVSNLKLLHPLTRGAMVGAVKKVFEFPALFSPG